MRRICAEPRVCTHVGAQARQQAAEARAGEERSRDDQEIVLYRVAQGALTNVARHSRASSARPCP